MKKALAYLFCTLAVLVSVIHPCHARGLDSRLTVNRIFESAPKNVITASVEVTNSTDRPVECVPQIRLPAGWKPVTPPSTFRLERNQTYVVLVSFYIPGNALAGSYDVDIFIASTKDPSLSTHQSIIVQVLPVAGLKVSLVESPRSVISGQEYACSFLMTNESNQENRIGLSVVSSDGLLFTADAQEITLPPGSSHMLKVTVQTRELTGAALKHRVECTAFVIGKEEIRSQAQSLVEIIPLKGRKDIYHTVPVTLRLRQALEVDEKTKSPFQAELQGEGTFDEAGAHNISFLFRGPDTMNRSLMGSRDNYTLRTWSGTYDLTAGDAQFSLSELTEQYLFARGAKGLLTYKGLTLQGYRAETPWLTPKVSQTAASFGYAAFDGVSFAVNGLTKDKEDLEGSDKLLTAMAELKPAQTLNIRLEGGMGKHCEERDNAYLVKLSYTDDKTVSRIRYVHAQPDFPGYYQDRELLSFDLATPLSETLQANASFNREKNNLDMNDLLYNSALDTLYQAGLSYLYGKDTTLSAAWQYRMTRDRMDSPDFDYSSHTLRAGVLQNFSRLSLNLTGETGRKKDRLGSDSELIYQLSTSLYFRATNEQTYGAYFRYAQGQNAETGTDKSFTSGLSGSYLIASSTRFQCSGQMDTYSRSIQGNKYMLASSLNHMFADRSSLSLQASRSFYTGTEENTVDQTSVILEYAYPFSLPVGRKKGTSSVSGIVRDALTGEPLADVMLRLEDKTAATDKDGRFMFSAIGSGVAYLGIDTSRLGLDRISTCRNPLPVHIDPEQEKTVEIGITKKATITGRVVLYGTGTDAAASLYEFDKPEEFTPRTVKPQELKEISGMTHVLVELSSPAETLRVLTDSQGRFSFNEVRPGTWTLTIGTENLPAHYGLDRNKIGLTLTPGQTQDFLIKAQPKKRSVRIIDQGGTIIQKPSK